MITKSQAMWCGTFYHRTERNADGTAVRCRANGKCQTWKTRPDDFRLPVKYGLKFCFYITPVNAADWLTYDPTSTADVATMVGLQYYTQPHVVMDKADDDGVYHNLKCIKGCPCGRQNG